MRSTAVAGITLLTVILAGAGCSQPADPSVELSTSKPDVSDGPSPGTSPDEASEAPANGVAITFDKVKSKHWGDEPFEVKAEASTGVNVKYTAKGACTVTPRGGRVEIKEAGDFGSRPPPQRANPAKNKRRSVWLRRTPRSSSRARTSASSDRCPMP